MTNTSRTSQINASTPEAELRLPGMLSGAAIVVAAFGVLALVMHVTAAQLPRMGPDFAQWLARVGSGDVLARLQWAIGDMTEPQFYKAWLASLGLLAGGLLAWWAGNRGHTWAGMPIGLGSGLWPWIAGASTFSLILSNLAFGWLTEHGWQPTFVPFVCVAGSLVLVYGGGWPVFFTGAILGAITTTPVAMLLIEYVTGPAQLPAVVSCTAAMSIGAAFTFAVSRHLPWMRLPPADEDNQPGRTIKGAPSARKDAIWTIRRIFADFTEAPFFANELASIGMLGGVLLMFLLNPDLVALGAGLLPQLLFAQVLTAAIGIVVWRHLYRGGGWAPTYISLVSVAPASVLTFDGSALSIVVGAVGGALLCPVIARPISARLPRDYHPFIGNTTSMAVSSAVIVTALRLLS